MLLGFKYLNIQYMKTFHPNVMKFTAFTKHDMGVLCMNFLSNHSILQIWYNFTLNSYLGLTRPSLGVGNYRIYALESNYH